MAFLIPHSVFAQEASPFDDVPPAAEPADAPPAAAPDRPQPGDRAADTADTEPVQPAFETNPAVRAVLEAPRKEPRDYVQAILLLVDLGRPELAKPIMADLAKLNLTNDQRIAIVTEFGPQGMLHIARAKELQPEAATFVDATMAAANAAANNPERIAALVSQLADPSLEVRTIARNDLAATGQVGATATLEALARETDPQRRAAMLAAIELMHPLVDGPLLAMLETNDPQLRADVAAVLERLRVPQAAALLSTDTATAERTLAAALSNYQRGTPPFATDGLNQVEIWKWNDATKKLSSVRVPADQAQVLLDRPPRRRTGPHSPR